MQTNRPQAPLVAAYSLKNHDSITSIPLEEVRRSTMRMDRPYAAHPATTVQGCDCHRSENARMAPEPHLHAVEAGRIHSSNQKCLKGRRRTWRSKSWRSGYPRHQRCRQDQTLQRCGICSVHDAVTRNNNVCRLSCLLSAHCI